MAHKTQPTAVGSSAQCMTPSYLCEMCSNYRLTGSSLLPRIDTPETVMWMCTDCQHKLMRCVDDEGSLGG